MSRNYVPTQSLKLNLTLRVHTQARVFCVMWTVECRKLSRRNLWKIKCGTVHGAGLLWGYGLLRRGYILLCHTKVINRHVTESEDMLLLFRQLYNAYPYVFTFCYVSKNNSKFANIDNVKCFVDISDVTHPARVLRK